MNRYFCIFLLCFLVISCNQNKSRSDKEAIKELQERVRILEKEIQELKGTTDSTIVPHGTKQISGSSNDYFTIGSTENEVIQVMGDPTNYYDFGTGDKRFQYGVSSVIFHKGKVESYNNLDGNLKVKVKK